MRPRSLRGWAILTWLAALIAISLAVTIRGKPGKLYPTFVAAGDHFRLGEPIYGPVPEGQDQYRYSPLIAASFAPWGFLPTSVGSVLWRCLQALALLLALRAWSRVAVPSVPWPAFALLVLPLAAGNLFNGQLNPIVAALLLASLAAFARERYGLAAAAIAAATMIKVYPLSLGLLLCVVEPRRFTPRLILALAIGAGLPFVIQDPRYVSQQFADWKERIDIDDRTDQEIHRGYHDFQKLLRRWGLPTQLTTYRYMEVAAGCAAAAFLFWGRGRGWTRDQQIQTCADLGLIWCTLFGPATESATYMLLAPMAAHAMLAVTGRSIWERIAIRGAYFLLLSVPIAFWFSREISGPYRALIPQAHAAMILLCWAIARASLRPAGHLACATPDRSNGEPDLHRE
jgi:Glycosyltransferase family 87